MKQTFKMLIAAASVVSVVAAAGTASADVVKCHAAIGKTVAKLVVAGVGEIADLRWSATRGAVCRATRAALVAN